MVAYNFKARFVDPIETRFKRQTIRPNRKRNPRPGEALQLYTGMRTRHCRKLWAPDPICTCVTPIKIDRGSVELGGQPLTVEQQTELAIADGFASLEEFQKFFYGADSMSPSYTLPFEGVLIEWE
ncbi:hypothetical protein H6G00_00990 [Leptolyngbya sp. FACHB-541]|uniref:hypothetical protein n=1 Tax=Leptolyngbya sp. FACHB-541 TaxID=2692810 RepID=UPI001682FB86|nr:hypothetical protein [Leptolyngbya sp. FACHB-541]MBD1995204.1 hypothetical protein [Leptolyngbya sp. FACHB-541]